MCIFPSSSSPAQRTWVLPLGSHPQAVLSTHLRAGQSHPSAGHLYTGLYGNTSGVNFGYVLVLISLLLPLAASWEGAEALIHDQYWLPTSALFPRASAAPKCNPHRPAIVPMGHKGDPWSPP